MESLKFFKSVINDVHREVFFLRLFIDSGFFLMFQISIFYVSNIVFLFKKIITIKDKLTIE